MDGMVLFKILIVKGILFDHPVRDSYEIRLGICYTVFFVLDNY